MCNLPANAVIILVLLFNAVLRAKTNTFNRKLWKLFFYTSQESLNVNFLHTDLLVVFLITEKLIETTLFNLIPKYTLTFRR